MRSSATHGPGRTVQRIEAVPGRRVECGNAGPGRDRHIRQRRDARLAGGGVALARLRRHVGCRPGGGIAIDVDVASDDVVQRRPAALLADLRELRAGGAHEHQAAELRGRAESDIAEAQLVTLAADTRIILLKSLARPRPRDQFLSLGIETDTDLRPF